MSTLNVPWSVGSMCEGPEGAPNKAWSCTGSQRASWNWVVSASARCEDMEKSRRKYFADCAKLSGPALNETNETPQVHLQRSMTLYATMYSIFLRLFGLFLKQYCEVRGLGQGQNTVWSTEGHGQFGMVDAMLTFVMVGCNAWYSRGFRITSASCSPWIKGQFEVFVQCVAAVSAVSPINSAAHLTHLLTHLIGIAFF